MSASTHRVFALLGVVTFVWSCSMPTGQGLAKAQAQTDAVNTDSPKPLMRFPDIHGDTIVFVYGEDIWSVPVEGGIATRLTIHDGEERFPKFSPDGRLIAFTGEYDGNTDVYVMNAHGGQIRRVTYHPGPDEVIGWHPSNGKILFQSPRASFNRFSRLFLISPDGTGVEGLILHEAANGSFSPDGNRIVYNKVARENRTWKRYRGGTAQDLYLYDLTADRETKLTDFPGTDRLPTWVGDRIYFSSDRDRVLNLYSLDLDTRDVRQLTRHADYDVRRPSAGPGALVYEVGGTLWVLDLETERTRQVPVEIRGDAPEARPFLEKVDDEITGYSLSPSGKRALVVARGEIFTVPREHGPTRNLTKDSGARDKDAAWSPDGRRVAYLSDGSGEYELYLVDPKGETEAVRLTRHRDGYRHTLRWSPDGKKIAFADQTLRCYYLDVESKEITPIDKAEFENVDVSLDSKPIHDFAWSPDGRYIAYTKMNADLLNQIYIFSVEDGTVRCVGNGVFNDFNPVFTTDGEHLVFLSNRRFDPTYCDFEWEMVYKNVAGIYALTLRADGPSMFPFQSDEEDQENEEEATGDETASDDAAGRTREQAAPDTPPQGETEPKNGSAKDDDANRKREKDDQPLIVTIDFDGLSERVEAFPVNAGNYRSLAVNDDGLFYLHAEKGDFNFFEFRPLGPMNLYRFSFEDREETLLVKGVEGYSLSPSGEGIIYKIEDSLGVISANGSPGSGSDLDLSELAMWIDPELEWRQIFREAWRMERDFYYEPNMHGLNWEAIGRKYEVLLPHASCRQDVQYLIGEMIGELNTSHTYVFGGHKQREADSISVGLLGADWEADAGSNRYRFRRIYRTPDWTREIEPPLAKQGVQVREGDYLIAVNGLDVTADRSVFSYFQDLANRQVTIKVNDRPVPDGAREYAVKPLANDYLLRYLDWTEHNRKLVERESGGTIGYLHLPDTFTRSAAEFPRFFYGITRRKGLIVDGRYNGGGLDPDIFLQRLDKKLLTYWTRRYSHDQTTPFVVTNAHMVCLTNRQAGSGGDMLPMEFKMRGMGPVIGTRTWGGLVGVSMFIRLIDGGTITAPDYRIYDTKGKWIVENEGVEPDVVVDLHPAEVARGYDAQLAKAIEILKEKIVRDPRPWPRHEPFPTDR